MEINDNRFLLHLHLEKTGPSSGARPLEPFRVYPTFHAALADLFAIPMDQFLPATAHGNGYGEFVEEALIVDLVNGRPLVSTLYLTEEIARQGTDGVYLVIEQGVPVTILGIELQGIPAGHTPNQPVTAPFMGYDKQGNYLFPTADYQALFQRTLAEMASGHPPLLAEDYAVSFEGMQRRMEKPGEPYTKPVFRKHYFATAADAFRFYLDVAPSAFDARTMVNTGQPQFFEKGYITHEAKFSALLANIELIIPQNVEMYERNKAPGLYLKTKDLLQFAEQVGISLQHFESVPDEKDTIQTCAWINGKLTSLPWYKQLIDQSGKNMVDAPTPPLYSGIIDNKTTPDAVTLTDEHFYLPPTPLAGALSHLAFTYFETLRHLLDNQEISQRETIATLQDGQQAPVLSIRHGKGQGFFLQDRVYLGVQDGFWTLPGITAFQPEQLLQGSMQDSFIEHGNTFFDIAAVSEKDILYNHGFSKFIFSLLAGHAQQHLLNQGPRPVHPIPRPGQGYLMAVQWEYPNYEGQLQTMTVYQPWATSSAAISGLSRIPDEFFLAKPDDNLHYPLRIVSVEIFNRQNQLLLKKAADFITGVSQFVLYPEFLAEYDRSAFQDFAERAKQPKTGEGPAPPQQGGTRARYLPFPLGRKGTHL